MAKLNFCFSGWVNGANVNKVNIVKTGDEIDVSGETAETIIKNLCEGVWSISLEDHLYRNSDVDISDYEESDL